MTAAASPSPARDAIAALQGHEAWAIIRRSTRAGDRETVGLVGGRRRVVDSLLDIPLEDGVPEDGHIADRLVAVPFRQVRERGFEAHDDGTPLVVVDVETELEFSVDEVIDAIDDTGVDLADRGGFDIDDTAYADLVAAIIRDEIGQGEGANLVVGRHYRAQVADWDAGKALTVFRRLLAARARRLLDIRVLHRRPLPHRSEPRAARVGARRRRTDEPDQRDLPAGLGAARPTNRATCAATCWSSCGDEKEIFELFMVVDEELKMMCDVCDKGGQVLGPFLKPMSRLIHTEYFLAGRTSRDPREVLRDTMYAATVTGSPVQNACRLIKKYESEGRGYYGAALAILGRDADGAPVVDSPIVIRTADVDLEGRLTVTAGATLVRDSDPAYEVAETHAKAGGILAAFGLVAPAPTPSINVAELVNDEDVAAGAVRPQPAPRVVLAHRPVGRAAGPRPGREAGGDPRRRGRLREHAPPRARCRRDDEHGRPARVVRRGVAGRRRPGDRRTRPRRSARRRRPEDRDVPREPSTGCWPAAGRSWRSASATRCSVTGSASRWSTRTSCSRAPRTRWCSTGAGSGSGFYNTFVGRVSPDAGATRRRLGRRRPGHRRRPPGARPALPRHPVPRGVDPDPARRRPDPPPARPTSWADRVTSRTAVSGTRQDA